MVTGDYYGISAMMGRSPFARPLVVLLLFKIESLRNRTAERRGWPNVYVYQTGQGYYLRALS